MSQAAKNHASFDPVAFEIVRNAITGIADEMVLTIVRTGYSAVVRDVMDFSAGLCDAEGKMVAQGLSLPVHLGSIPDAMVAIHNAFPDDINPGDVFILNDPYEGGMHLPDIFIVKPIFTDEGLLGFAATVCHHTDIGGRVAGGNASDSTEIYQEGLRIPPLRLYHKGEPDPSLFRILEKNVRVPVYVLGDLRAQLSACHVAEREIQRLAQRYGHEGMKTYFQELIAYSERRTRAAIREWPDGVYEFTDYLDDDGFGAEDLKIKVTLTVDGDEILVDFTGSAPQTKGAINATASITKAVAYASAHYLVGPDIPSNEGFFRPIKVIAPAGTIVNAVEPAATAARGATVFRMGDAVLGAFAKMAPDRMFAATEGGNTGVSIGGYDQNRKPFIMVDFICASWGGRPFADGLDGNTNPFENLSNGPIEITEMTLPLRIERYGFVPDTGGPGRYRGGLAIVKEYRLLEEEAVCQVRSDRRKYLPYGLAGGKPGTPSLNIWNPGENEEILPAKFTRMMKRGDLLRHQTAGAGGHGDPFTRDPYAVLDDVLQEKVSVEAARREYGVVIAEDGKTLDLEATETLRAQRGEPQAAAQPAGRQA